MADTTHRKSSLFDNVSGELIIVHRTSDPFTPRIPQTSVCSVQTQTHYSVSPVQIEPCSYNVTPFLGRQSSTRSMVGRPPTLGRWNSTRSIVSNGSFTTVYNDAASPGGKSIDI